MASICAQQAPFAAPGMQQVPPQYAAMGYGHQYPYMPQYGMPNAYFPQHPGGYGGYPAQVLSISLHPHPVAGCSDSHCLTTIRSLQNIEVAVCANLLMLHSSFNDA